MHSSDTFTSSFSLNYKYRTQNCPPSKIITKAKQDESYLPSSYIYKRSIISVSHYTVTLSSK